MKNMAKKLISFLLVAVMVFGTAPVSAFAAQTEQTNAKTGSSTTWNFDSDTGVLTVSGSGDMDNLINPSDYPWYIYKNEIKTVVIESGITSVGTNAFNGYMITDVTVASTVKYIGDGAFENCSNLNEINADASFTGFGINSFAGTAHYENPANRRNGAYYINDTIVEVEAEGTEYTIPSDALAIADYAVISSSIKNINIPANVKHIGSRAFAQATSLVTITVDEENSDFSSDASGALYSKDMTKLICVPASAENMSKTYNVNYYVDGELVHTEPVEEYKPIPEYVYDPGEGRTFSGWSEIPETMPEKDIDIYGTCTVNIYTITFVINEEIYATAEYSYGSSVVAPEYSVPLGHAFSGWKTPATMPAQNLTLKATLTVCTYNAIFYLDDAQTMIHASVPTAFGEKINFPAEPKKNGYVFLGWDDESTVMDTEGKAYVAIWAEQEFIIEFFGFSGGSVKTISAYAGQIINRDDIPEPTYPGYVFEGWVDEDGDSVSFPITVTGNMSFNAMFVAGVSQYSVEIYVMNTEGEYKLASEIFYSATTDSYVTYTPETREGFSVDNSLSKLEDYVTSDETIKLYVYYSRNKYNVTLDGVTKQYYYGETVTLSAPVIEGFVFNGWYDEEGNRYTDSFTVPAYSTVLHSIFTAKKYTLTFNVDGFVYQTVQCQYGETVDAPAPPTKEGYTFEGWMMNGELVSFPITVTSDGLMFDAVFSMNAMTNYTVDIYLMGTDGTYSDAPSRSNAEVGVSDTTVTAAHSDYIQDEWFSADTSAANVTSGKISPDGSTRLKLYYKRNMYTVSFDGVDYQAYYGATIPVPQNPTKNGYTFAGWHDEDGKTPSDYGTMPMKKLSFISAWNAKTGVEYILEIYEMDLNGQYSIVPSTNHLTGTYGETVTADYTVPEGFSIDNSKSVVSGVVSDPEILVLKVYFARNIYTVTYMVDGMVLDSLDYYHGTSLDDIFGGAYLWKNSDGTEVSFPLTVTENITLYGETYISSEPSWEIREGVTVNEFDGVTVLGFEGALTEQQIADCFECNEYAYISVTANNSGKYSTGALVEVCDAELGDVLATYYIAVSGDLNGDGAVNGDDGYIINDEIIGVTNWSIMLLPEEFDPAKFVAADADSDGLIRSSDFVLLGFVGYVIESYVMHIGGAYSEGEVKNLIGMKGQTVTAETNPAEGYFVNTEKSVLSATLETNKTTVLSVYYDIQKYTVTYVILDQNVVKEYYYGEAVEIPADPAVENYIFVGWDTEIPATMPATDLIINATFERVPVMLIPAEGSTTVIDREEMCVYGINVRRFTESSIRSVLDVQGDGFITIIPNNDSRYGTGTTVEVWDNMTMEVVESFTIVVFGDVDGDSVISGSDYVIIRDEVLHITSWSHSDSDTFNPYMLKAAELNGDGVITATDREIVQGVVLGIYELDQSCGRVNSPSQFDPSVDDGMNLNISTKIFKQNSNGDWVATDKVKSGEAVKARVYVDTDFYANAGSILLHFDKNVFELSSAYGEIAFNQTFLTKGFDGTYSSNANINSFLVRKGIIDEAFAAEYDSIMVSYSLPYKSQKIDGSEWFFEIPLTVKENASGEGKLFVLEEATASPSFPEGLTNVSKGSYDEDVSQAFDMGLWQANISYTNTPVTVYTPVSITFNANGGAFADGTSEISIEDEAGAEVPEIETPVKEGYYLAGWSFDPYVTMLTELPEVFPEEDTAYYAIFESKLYNITYHVYMPDGELHKSLPGGNREYGDFIPLVPVIFETPEGYVLSPAYKNQELTELYSEGSLMPANDVDVYFILEPLDYVAEFDANGGNWADGDTAKTVTATFDSQIIAPEDPVREGYRFIGWTPDVSIMDEDGKTFVATWETEEYSVIYAVDGECHEEFYVEYGEEIDIPPDPYKEGHTFVGWTPAIPATMPAFPMEFTAVFEVNQYEVTFCVDGENYTTVYNYGEPIETPADPYKEGYIFAGWTPEIPATMPAEDLEFNAIFAAPQYTVTFDANRGIFSDGESKKTVEVDFGATVDNPYYDPTREGYIFAGWMYEDGSPVSFPIQMPAKNLTFVPDWRQDLCYCRINNIYLVSNGVYKQQNALYEIVVKENPDKIEFVENNSGNYESKIIFDRNDSFVSDDLSEIGVVSIKAYDYDGVEVEAGSPEVYYEVWTVVASLAEGEYKVRANIDGTEEGWENIDFAYDYIVIFYPRDFFLNLDANGGEFADGSTYKHILGIYGESIEDSYEEPSRDGYVFCGWQDVDGNEVVINGTMPDIDGTIYAQWAEIITGTYENLTYSFNEATGELVISGEGDMPEDCHNAPWYEFDDSVKTITVNEGITSIGYGAFGNWCFTEVVKVTLPDGLKAIGDNAFGGCESLTSITIPDSVTSIGDGAFEYCYFLESLTIGKDVGIIGYNALYACDSLSRITVDPANAVFSSDEYGALFNKDKTELIRYPVGNSRTEYIIPDGVVTIYEYAFEFCSWLTSITIPNSVTSIGYSSFYYCDLTDVYYAGTEEQWNAITVAGGNEDLTDATIHYESSGPEPVSTFSLRSFFGLSKNTSGEVVFKVPETVTEIGDYAFTYSKATKVKIPASVAVISETAFAEAAALEYIEVDGENAVYTDKNGILFTADGEKIVAYPRAMTDSSYTLPLGTKSIGNYAFNGSILEKIYLPSSLETIGDYSFCNSYSLTYADIENNVTYIGDFAFCGCALENAKMPSKLETVGNYAFFGSSLTEVEISESVTDIGSFAYAGNFSLEEITVNNNNPSYESDGNGVLYTKGQSLLIQYPAANAQTDFVIPETVSETADMAFFASENLENIVLNENLAFIGDYAFDGCTSIKELILPDSVERVGDGAFNGCAGVMKMKLDAKFASSVDFREMITLMDLQFTGDTSGITIPEQIINFEAVGSYDNIHLSWSKSAEARSTSYRIFRKGQNGGDWSHLSTINSRTTLTYTDLTAEEDVFYNYVIVTADEKTGIISPMSLEAVGSKSEDTVPPVITKITPEGLSYISGTKAFTVYASDDLMMSKVTLQYSTDGGNRWTFIGTDSSDPYTFSLDTTALSDGVIKVKALAYDTSGNESEPMTLSYTVDNTGPQKITGLRVSESTATSVTVAWDDVVAGDAALFILQMKNEDGTYRTISSSISDLGYEVTGLAPDTDYIFRVAAKDEQGNLGEYSDDFTASTSSDTTAPDTHNLLPTSGRHNKDISFKVTATDNYAIKSIEIQVSADRVYWETVDSVEYTDRSRSKTFSSVISVSDYNDGSIFVRAVATDFAGNNNVDDGSFDLVEYIVDTTAPASPEGLYAAGGDGWIYLRWEIGSETDLSTYSVYRSTEKDGNYALIANYLKSYDYYDTSAKRDTVYYYKIRVIDSLGNISDFSAPVAAKVADDVTPPQIISISPVSGSEMSPIYKTISVYAKDNASLANIRVEYRTNDNEEYTVIDNFEISGNASVTAKSDLPVESLAHGDRITVHAVVTDITGLIAEQTVEYTYAVDTEAPVLSNLGVVVDGDYCKITWTDPTDTDASGYKIYRVNNDGTFELLGSRAKSSRHSYTFYDNVSVLGTGDYAYKVEAYDASGNMNSYITDSVHYEYVPDEDDGENGGGNEGTDPDDPDTPVNSAPNVRISAYNDLEVGVEEYFDAGGSFDDSQIVSFLWDFGDGTTSNEVKAAKKYTAVGVYTVTLTVTDDGGLSTSATFDVTVHEREALGIVKVTVLDSDGKPVPQAPVYFDVGSEDEKAVATDKNGVASMRMKSGTYTVCVRIEDYVPDIKTVTVLPNSERRITLRFIEQKIVEGEFEVKRLTHEEVLAAGIDPSDHDNQNFYQTTVIINYGGSTIPLNYIRNDKEIIGGTVSGGNSNVITNSGGNDNAKPNPNPNPNPGPVPPVPTPDPIIIKTESGYKELSPVLIPNDTGEEMIMMLEMPVGAKSLKEMFEVSLHLINNAHPAFSLLENEIVLNIPEGMSLVKSSPNKERVTLDTIEDGTTIRWLLKGDEEGEHCLSADYNGKLSIFKDSPVTASFSTYIRVYGMSDIKINLEVSDEIRYNAFYFNIGLVNDGTVDQLNLNLDYDAVVRNISASALQRMKQEETGEEGEVDTSGDFEVPATLMNVRYVYADGTYSYIPYTVSDGNIITGVDTVAPGEAIYYEYVAYNAINYDGVAVFEDAAVEELGKYSSNVTVTPISMNLYDKLNVVEHLAKYSSIDKNSLNYLITDGNYFYWNQATGTAENSIGRALYNCSDAVLGSGFAELRHSQKYILAEKVLLHHFAGTDVIENIGDLVEEKYVFVIQKILSDLKSGFVSDDFEEDANVQAALEWIENAINDYDLLAEYGAAIRMKGAEGLKGDLIAALCVAGEAQLVKYDSFEFLNDDYVVNAFADLCNYSKELLDPAILDPVKNVSREYFNQYIYNAVQTSVCTETVKFITSIFEKYAESSFLDSDYVGIVRILSEKYSSVAESRNLAIVTQLRDSLKAFDFVDDIITGNMIIQEILSPISNRTNYLYTILDIAYDSFESIAGIGREYKSEDIITLAECVSTVFVNAWIDYHAKYEYNGQTLAAAVDASHILMYLAQSRLAGESLFKEFAENFEEDFLRSLNEEFHSDYESNEEVYDEVYKNILEARDIIFNIEETQATEKPAAPVVSINYDTLSTNEKFDETYEYCYSDGEWKRCNGEKIPIKLKSHTTVLRVRKASAEGKLSGEITTVNIWGQREMRKNISVKYDNGVYYFTNLSSLYSYQICPLEKQYEKPDWSNAVTVVGGYNACANAEFGKYLAIRTCENPEKKELVSKPLILEVNTKQTLTVSVWGSGSVTQSAENGRYFIGEDAYLTAIPNESVFEGWYIDGVRVGSTKDYILEMYEFAEIVAKFSGNSDVDAESASISILTDNEIYSLSSGQVVPMIYAGAKGKLIVDITPENATDKSVSWQSSNENIAVINANGIISFLRSGSVTVTATLANGITESVKITVLANGVEECYIESMPDKTTYYEDEELNLDGLVLMAKYTNGTVKEVSNYTVEGFDSSAGEKTVILGYNGINTELKVNVVHNCRYTVSKESTCTEEGVKTRYCVICGMIVDTQSIPVTEHACKWVITQEATPEAKGVKEFVCTVCGISTQTESVDYCEHEFNTVIVSAECGKEGYTVYNCSKCGYEKTDDYTEALSHSYTETIIEPTCTVNGCTVRICRFCSDKIITDIISATGHNYVEEQIEASCSSEGYILHACLNCGDSYKTNLVKKLPHSYSSEVTEPTCSVMGYTTHTCSVCGNSYVSDEVDAVAHEYESEKVFSDCSQGGYTLNTCKVCGNTSKTDPVEPADHEYGEWIIRTPSSESATGLKYRICTVCGKEETQIVPVVDHEHISGEWVVETEAGCDGYGTKVRRCEKCKEIVESQIIPALGHKYSSEVIAPTCTTDGYTVHICSECGKVRTDSIVPSTGHTNGEWITAVEPDCDNTGVRERYCTECGILTNEETVPALNHSSWHWQVITQVTCTTSGIRLKVCDYCEKNISEETITAEGHKYSAQVTPKTCTEDGFTTYTCSVCFHTYEDGRIEATGHVSGDWVVSVEPTVETEGKREKRCKECGELLDSSVVPTLKEPVSGITISAQELEIICEETEVLIATVTPENAVDKTVIWSSDNPKIVCVDENGKITAVSPGVATITVSTANGEFSASCAVTVLSNMYKISWIVDGETMTETVRLGTEIEPPANPEKKGYTFVGWTPDIPETVPDYDLEFTAIWSADSYDAVFDANGGKWADGETTKTVSTVFDSQITVPEAPSREGYYFGGWDKTVSIMDDVDGKIFRAVWFATNESFYTVETYLMNTEGVYEKSARTLGGVGGSTITLSPEPEAGLVLNTEKSVLTGMVTADNALVLKVYIDREIYTLTTVVDGVNTSADYYYGAVLAEIAVPEKNGFVFTGWDKPVPQTMPASDLTVIAVFKKMNTSVKIDNNPGSATIKHGETLLLVASMSEMPDGAYLVWYVDGVESAQGTSFYLSVPEGSVTVEVKAVDKNGNVMLDENGNEISDSQTITVNSSIWQKIVSFFKNLFRMNRTVIQSMFKN